jgi:hypothetical protein
LLNCQKMRGKGSQLRTKRLQSGYAGHLILNKLFHCREAGQNCSGIFGNGRATSEWQYRTSKRFTVDVHLLEAVASLPVPDKRSIRAAISYMPMCVSILNTTNLEKSISHRRPSLVEGRNKAGRLGPTGAMGSHRTDHFQVPD